MRLAVLGGGGFRVPLVHKAVLDDTGEPRVSEFALYDPSPERLAVIESVLTQQARGVPGAPRVLATTTLDEALTGADFVFSAIRVGGLAARTRDERVALALGVLGQETTGPGGIAYGLRTVPVMRHIASRVAAVCPQAYVINFTNPAGMITEAMQAVLGERVVGVCDTPAGLGRRVGTLLGARPAPLRLDYVGLNHLGWLRGVYDGEADLLPGLLADDALLDRLVESELFGVDWLRLLGAVPNEYLYYYYFNRDAIRALLAGERTRGEFLLAQQGDFYAAAAAQPGRALELWRRTRAEREAQYMAEARRSERAQDEGGGYEQIALAVMTAIARDDPATLILNVRGGGTVSGFDADAVVEIPARVDASGVHPLPAAAPDPHQLGLMQQVKAVERLTIEAAVSGSRDAALKAFALHPLVDSVSVARELLRGYVDAIPEVAAVLRQSS